MGNNIAVITILLACILVAGLLVMVESDKRFINTYNKKRFSRWV